MTAKQEAEEIVLKFRELPQEDTMMFYLAFEISKQCAHIVVDKLLEYSKAHGFIGLTEHYEQVKIEIFTI